MLVMQLEYSVAIQVPGKGLFGWNRFFCLGFFEVFEDVGGEVIVLLDEVLADHIVAGVEAAVKFLEFVESEVENILHNEVVLQESWGGYVGAKFVENGVQENSFDDSVLLAEGHFELVAMESVEENQKRNISSVEN